MIKAKANSTSLKKSTPVVKKTTAPTTKKVVAPKTKSVILKKEPTLLKREFVEAKKEAIPKEKPMAICHTVGKRLQTAEGWKRSMIVQRTTSKKAKKS